MKFIDLFSGLGGFHLAAADLGAKCVFACEIDKGLQDLYKRNFGIEPTGDIRDVSIDDIPLHDLLCAGFPCQPFSKAGSQEGWNDKIRGTVFENVVKILEARRPEMVILENVAHFVRHDDGNTYRKVQQELERIGYEVDYAQLSPHQFGVPQIRERMYMVGRLKSAGGLDGFQWAQPKTNGNHLSIKNVLDERPTEAIGLSGQVIRCLETWQEFLQAYPKDEELPSFPIWAMEFRASYPYEQDSLYDVKLPVLRKARGSFGCSLDTKFRVDILERVPSHARGKSIAFPRWKQTFIRQNRELYQRNKKWIDPWLSKINTFPPSLQKFEWNCKGEERNIWNYVIQFRASGVRVKRPTTSPSLVAMTTTQVPIIGWEKRYMTARECARLQSMDRLQYLPPGGAAMKALGNAVNVKVVQAILENLFRLRRPQVLFCAPRKSYLQLIPNSCALLLL